MEEIIRRTGGYPVHASHKGGQPENTMYGFRRAVKYGARLLELDLRLTKDKQLILMHDSTVDRTTDGVGPVSAFLLGEITRLDAAYYHPTLKGKGITVATFNEFIEEFSCIEDLLFLFDFKDCEAVRKTQEIIERYPIKNRYIFGSVFEECNTLLREVRHSSDVPVITDITQTFLATIAYGTGLWRFYHFVHDIYGFILLEKTRKFFTRGLVDALHEKGVKVLVCGDDLDKKEVLQQCIDYGVDYIMTDRSDVLGNLLNK